MPPDFLGWEVFRDGVGKVRDGQLLQEALLCGASIACQRRAGTHQRAILGQALAGTTDMEGGIDVAFAMLRRSPPGRLRNAILITDGRPDSRTRLEALVRQARRDRINLHTVGVGEPQNLDEALLRRLSSLTHRGRYQHVRSLQALAQALRAVG